MHKKELFGLHVNHQMEQQVLESRLKEESARKQEEGEQSSLCVHSAYLKSLPPNIFQIYLADHQHKAVSYR